MGGGQVRQSGRARGRERKIERKRDIENLGLHASRRRKAQEGDEGDDDRCARAGAAPGDGRGVGGGE